jgi:hypothetical protein
MANDLTEVDAEVFTRLANDPRVVVPASELILSPYEADAVVALEEAGLAAAFEWEGVPCVSMTPLAAEQAGLRVSRTVGGYRWVPADDPELPDRLEGMEKTGREALADDIAGWTPEPVEILEAAEEVERVIRRKSAARTNGQRPTDYERDPDHLPKPRILLEGCRPWVAPGVHKKRRRKNAEPCRACLGRPLGRNTYCLYCDRWGLDAVLEQWRKAVAAARTRPPKKIKFRPRMKVKA